MTFLLQLIIAHLAGDFFLQLNSWVKDKERLKWASPYLYLHCILHGLLILLISFSFVYWKQAVLIVISHLLIDGLKLQFQKEHSKRTWFFADQLLHFVAIILVWLTVTPFQFNPEWIYQPHVLLVVTAVLCLLSPTSYAIKFFISKWAPWPLKSSVEGTHIPSITKTEEESLENAGRIIGMIERILIFSFILLDKWQAIGFLLAAKSIFRFGQLNTAKDRRLTEYVLIGTLLSFFIAIMLAVIVVTLLNGGSIYD